MKTRWIYPPSRPSGILVAGECFRCDGLSNPRFAGDRSRPPIIMQAPFILPQSLKRWAAALSTACALSLLLACVPFVSGCSSTSAIPPQTQIAQPANVDLANIVANPNGQDAGCESTGALNQLWQQRIRENNSSSYPVGAGDVLQVTVTDLPEINKIEARVNGQGKINLPVLGELNVAGLTEEETSQLIAAKARTYVRDPRVNVYAQRFAGRNVSVAGMVALPGTYPLNSPSETILSILGRAGGLKGTGDEPAAQRVVLFPANTGARQSGPATDTDSPQPQAAIPNTVVASSGNPGINASDPFGNDSAGTEAVGHGSMPTGQSSSPVMPIIIDLSKPSMASCLNLPARPGDIILVPAAGQVGVYGWVRNPGQFNITPGMTVLSAITSAGGAMFSSNVDLLRTSHGNRVSTLMDLSKVENGQEADHAVQSGDVIVVKSSAIGAIPYGLYTLLNKFGTGMYLAPGL
jgi:polysaccharide biosynthesis/export protein